MAVVKIIIKDMGNGDLEFSVDSFPPQTQEEYDKGIFTPSQYVAMKILDFMENGMDYETSMRIFTNMGGVVKKKDLQ